MKGKQHATAAPGPAAAVLGSATAATVAAAAPDGAAAATATTGAATAAQRPHDYAERVLRFASDGVEPVRVAIKEFPTGRGLVAEEDVEAGGVLLSVPMTRVFTSQVGGWWWHARWGRVGLLQQR